MIKRKAKAKKNPFGITEFAHLASGALSLVQINEMIKRKPAKKKVVRKAATRRKNPGKQLSVVSGQWSAKKNPQYRVHSDGTVHLTRAEFAKVHPDAKFDKWSKHYPAILLHNKVYRVTFKSTTKRNPAAAKAPAQRTQKTQQTQKTRLAANPRKQVTVPAKGDYYLLTIGSGDDIMAVYLQDGDKDGFSKRFKTVAAAKSFATKKRLKLKSNPQAVKATAAITKALKANPEALPNGILSRALARRRAAKEYKKELRLKAAAGRARSRRAKAEAKARKNPVANKPVTTKKVVKLVVTNPKPVARKAVVVNPKKRRPPRRKPTRATPPPPRKAAKRKSNPVSVPRRRTFEMFQGRKATAVRELEVSRHAPRKLDQLGDLVGFKLMDEKFERVVNPGKFKLCAAKGRLWIVGGRISRPDLSQPARVLNPVGHLDYVVYKTHKPHHGDAPNQHYIHSMGEAGGTLPLLTVDREGFPVLKGGEYKIRPEGVVN